MIRQVSSNMKNCKNMQSETESLLNQHSKFISCFNIAAYEYTGNVNEQRTQWNSARLQRAGKELAFVHVPALKRTAVSCCDIWEDSTRRKRPEISRHDGQMWQTSACQDVDVEPAGALRDPQTREQDRRKWSQVASQVKTASVLKPPKDAFYSVPLTILYVL